MPSSDTEILKVIRDWVNVIVRLPPPPTLCGPLSPFPPSTNTDNSPEGSDALTDPTRPTLSVAHLMEPLVTAEPLVTGVSLEIAILVVTRDHPLLWGNASRAATRALM